MGKFLVLIGGLIISFNSFSADKIVKTYDGHRVICQTLAQTKELSKVKAIQIRLFNQQSLVEIELVKCTDSELET